MINVKVRRSCVFRTRVRDESIGGDNPFKWEDETTEDLFQIKDSDFVFSTWGFYSTCSTYQLPDFEKLAEQFLQQGNRRDLLPIGQRRICNERQ